MKFIKTFFLIFRSESIKIRMKKGGGGKANRHDITEILLKVALNTIHQTRTYVHMWMSVLYIFRRLN